MKTVYGGVIYPVSDIIRSKSDIIRVKYENNLDYIRIEARDLFGKDLLSHAIKYGLWALKSSGLLEINGADRKALHLTPFDLNIHHLRHISQRLAGREAELEPLHPNGTGLTLRRTGIRLGRMWSAGVLFSGAEAEVPSIEACIAGLKAQPELAEGVGQVVLCGPTSAQELVRFLNVEYIPFDSPRSDRVPIARKKNWLMERLSGDKMLVLHSRIVLDPGALTAMPAEFDLITPRVVLRERGREQPYLDYLFTSDRDSLVMPRARPVSRLYDRAGYLGMMPRGAPYIDGGIFAVSKAAFKLCPLNDRLSWHELEDLEWCQRARTLGLLVDLAERACAVSQTNKLRPMRAGLPVADKAAREIARHARYTAAWLRSKIAGP